jgi:isoquinoline 1-oxidoreductase beta subunit
MTIALPNLTRRGFTFGISAVAGGLVFGALPLSAEEEHANVATKPELTAWVVIDPDDTVTIRIARSEMGQGIITSLPMLVAEELECDWARVRPEFVSVAENFARQRVWGDMVSTNSVSVRKSQDYLRKAGAQARMMLLAEAASRWNCPVEECTGSNSVVTHGGTGRTVRYGALAEAAARRPVPAEVALKRPQDWQLIGSRVPALGKRAQVTGQPIYAIDVRLPDMLYAAVNACPAYNGRVSQFEYGGKLKSFDAQKVLKMPGVRHVVPVGETAVAVVATTWWQAKTALEALPVVWDEAAGAGVSTDAIRKTLQQSLDATDVAIGRSVGNVDIALASAARVVTADHLVPYLGHATMEPQTCTAHVTADRAEVWAPTQSGEGTARAVAQALGIDISKVIIHKCQVGGGFGRRGLAQDWAQQAVLIAKAVGQPVKMLWTREEDTTHDFYRPMVCSRQTAGFDSAGKLIAWKTRLCGSSIFATLSPQAMRNGQDFGMMSGYLEKDLANGTAYEAPNLEVGYVMRAAPIPVGFWRGVNFSQNGFFREAFVDEMAHASGQDPYLFRRPLLAKSTRWLAVLDEAARRANWGHAPAGIYQGIAIVEHEDSVCAEVIELSVGADGAVKVHRVICVIDPVFVVHPDTAIAQMEGGIIQALGAALTGEITIDNGKVNQTNFHDYPLLRFNEIPRIETYLLPCGGDATLPWGSVGETAVPPLAPALVNAVFAATGKRIRSLPLKNHDLRSS